jgi:hypothetical protein
MVARRHATSTLPILRTGLSPRKDQMAIIVQRAIAIPVRALAWLGGQGTRAIAALRDHLRRPAIMLAATAWTTLGVPFTLASN